MKCGEEIFTGRKERARCITNRGEVAVMIGCHDTYIVVVDELMSHCCRLHLSTWETVHTLAVISHRSQRDDTQLSVRENDFVY